MYVLIIALTIFTITHVLCFTTIHPAAGTRQDIQQVRRPDRSCTHVTYPVVYSSCSVMEEGKENSFISLPICGKQWLFCLYQHQEEKALQAAVSLKRMTSAHWVRFTPLLLLLQEKRKADLRSVNTTQTDRLLWFLWQRQRGYNDKREKDVKFDAIR